MKFLLSLLFSCSFLTASATLTAQAEDPAVLAVKKAVTNFFDYNNEAYANSFTEQGALVNPMGWLMVSPETIFNAHVPLFNTYWKGTTSKATFLASTFRYLEEDLSLVQLKVEAVQSRDGQELDRSIYQTSAVIRRVGTGWKLELFQVTPVQPMEGK